MPELPRAFIEHGPDQNAVSSTSSPEVMVQASSTSLSERAADETLQVVEERLSVRKRRRSTGGVQVSTRTDIVDAVAEVELDRYSVEVMRWLRESGQGG